MLANKWALGAIFLLAAPLIASADGAWGPVVQFRDTTTPTHVPGRPMPPGGWYVTPIHATALSDGRALITGWGRFAESNCKLHETRQNGESWILDPKQLSPGVNPTLIISPISEDPKGLDDVLYCAGNVTLADGRVLMAGGARYKNLGDGTAYQPSDPNALTELEYGLPYFRIFDPSGRTFTRYEKAPHGAPPTQPLRPGDSADWYEEGMMWYPTETRLPGGKVLVAGGFTRNCGADGSCANSDLEIFDPAALAADPWSTWVPAVIAPNHGDYDPGLKDYTHTFLLYEPMPAELGDGIPRPILLMGYAGVAVGVSLDPSLDPSQRLFNTALTRPNGAQAWDSTAAMVGTGEVLIMGGGSDPRDEAQRIDLLDPQTGNWRSKDTGITRHNASSILLPDGTVLIVDGEAGLDTGPDARFAIGDRHQAQIYDPFTDELTTLPPWDDPNPAERGYHNLSLLLKNGQILTGGGMMTLAQVGCERPDARLFNPPYYRPGAAPVIDRFDETARLAYGDTLDVAFHGGATLRPRVANASASGIPVGVGRSGVVLVAQGSETHSFDQNQRYIPLDYDVKGTGRIRLHAPASSTLAPEGDYFLFLVDQSGAVSEGKHVRVGGRRPSFLGRLWRRITGR